MRLTKWGEALSEPSPKLFQANRALSFAWRLPAVVAIVSLMALGTTAAAQASAASVPPVETTAEDALAKSDTLTILVKGKRALNRIDRQIYDVSKDPQRGTDNAADTLKKIPGVNVDPDGGVSMRGNDVQIFINGKPSPLLAGDNRGAALRAMPSSVISSVEVMSNPGAQYSSGSAGGIINIVTKKVNLPGAFGSLGAQVVSSRAIRLNGLIQFNKAPFATNAFFNAAEEHNEGSNVLSQAELNADNVVVRSTESRGHSETFGRSVFLNGSVDYDIGPADTLTGALNFADFRNRFTTGSETRLYGSGHTLTDQYSSQGVSRFDNQNATADLAWTHLGVDLGENFRIGGKFSHAVNDVADTSLMDYSVFNQAPGHLESLRNLAGSDTTVTSLAADNNRFVGEDQLSFGFQFDAENSRSTTQLYDTATPANGLSLNRLLSSDFRYRQQLGAAYLTYQKAFGDHWAILGGLRIETFNFESPDPQGGRDARINYTNVNPSLFATYILSDIRKVRLNYARKLQRPTPWDLNPSLKFINTQTVSAGAPALRPQETESYEAAYEYVRGMKSYSLRLYHLDTDNVINPVTTVVPDPLNAGNQVIQISRRNAGTNSQTGLQLAYANSFFSKWFVNASAFADTTRMRVPDLIETRSLFSTSGQVSLSYRPTNADAFSFSYNYRGRQLTGDGYMSGYASGVLAYNRNLSPTLTFTVSLNDILKQAETLYVRNTGAIRTVSAARQSRPTFYIGLNRRFSSGSFSSAY